MPRRRKFSQQMVSRNCDGSFHKAWNMICSDEYPEDMGTKYGGYIIKDGSPYSVLSSERNPKHYLLIFGSAEVSQCKTLKAVNSTYFKCFAGVGKPKPLIYPRSRFDCVNYSFRMADELVSYCTTRYVDNNEIATVLYTEYDDKPTDAIIKYNSSSILNLNAWLFLVIVLISLFFIFRFR